MASGFLDDRKAPGQPLHIDARTWNAVLESARRVLGPAAGDLAGDELLARLYPRTTVLIRNDLGATAGARSVFRLGPPVVAPDTDPHPFNRRPAFAGLEPDTACDAVGISLGPIPDGAFDTVCVQGVCAADVNISSLNHRFATAQAGDTTALVSADHGPVRILWGPGSTGVQTCAVLLTGDQDEDCAGTTTTTTLPPCEGTCEFQWSGSTLYWTQTSDGCSEDCECHYPGFCGDTDGDVTTTYCAQLTGRHPNCGGTTTTCPPETTTTTTAPPCLSEQCEFVWDTEESAWIQTASCGAGPCQCAAPGEDGSTCGETVQTPCTTTTTTEPPPPSCTGGCKFWCGPADTAWQQVSNGCQWEGNISCYCEYPSAPCDGNCAYANTPCLSPESDPCDPTTTTTTPECGDPCVYRGDGSGGWTIISGTECEGGCLCYEPPYASTGTDDTAASPCEGDPTTTTTTPSPCDPCDSYSLTFAGNSSGFGCGQNICVLLDADDMTVDNAEGRVFQTIIDYWGYSGGVFYKYRHTIWLGIDKTGYYGARVGYTVADTSGGGAVGTGEAQWHESPWCQGDPDELPLVLSSGSCTWGTVTVDCDGVCTTTTTEPPPTTTTTAGPTSTTTTTSPPPPPTTTTTGGPTSTTTTTGGGPSTTTTTGGGSTTTTGGGPSTTTTTGGGSTTTTTGGGSPCGTCLYQWTSGSSTWEPLQGSCTGGCSCNPPSEPGTEDAEIRETDCIA